MVYHIPPAKYRFRYPKIKQINTQHGRLYVTPTNEKLPSVTTILSATSDQTHLNEWRRRVGNEQAQKITQRSTKIGSHLHKQIENYLTGQEVTFTKGIIGNMVKSMFQKIKKEAIDRIKFVIGVEVMLYYPGLYAGSTDLVAIMDEDEECLVICDHKNSKKIKKKEWCEDYFIQGAAYVLAHNNLLETQIDKFIIFMVSHPNDSNGKVDYEEFVIEGKELEHYTLLWLERVEQFYQKHGEQYGKIIEESIS